MHPFFPEQLRVVEALSPAADAAGRTSAYVSLKGVQRAWIVVHITQGNAATIALQPLKATAVAGTGATAITAAVPIWSDLDCAASDELVRRTDATIYTTDAGVKHKVVVFQIDPVSLGGAYDCLGISTGASNAANITQAAFLLEGRYGSAAPPSNVVD
jgi:hypothetical protein